MTKKVIHHLFVLLFVAFSVQAQEKVTVYNTYDEFAKNHPQFIQRFPQHLIASFLGITKETLSRIRKQSLK